MLRSNGKLVCPEVRIETTTLCNAHCVMCPREKLTRPLMAMNYGSFCNLVDQVKNLGAETISLFGFGEPLLDKTLDDKIRYCTESGLETYITTNGSLLTTNRAWELIDAGLKHIRFSCHGLKKYYDTVHPPLIWEVVEGNIRNFIELNKHTGYPTIIHMICMPMNGERVGDFVEHWEWKVGVDFLEVWKPHNWGAEKKYRKKTTARRDTCNRPFSGPLQINADGKMMTCCFDFNAELTIGDTTKESVLMILKDVRLRAIQLAHNLNSYDGMVCDTCDQRNIERDNPLLYSNRDPMRILNRTSTTKYAI